MKGAVIGGVSLILTAVLVIVLVVTSASEQQNQSASICGIGAPGRAATTGIGGIGPWDAEQVDNAAAILNAAQQLGLSERDQTIGVMTAIGESTLQVLDRGDAAGPDSRGLFQQRDNGAWGTYQERMDPHSSATAFFAVLATIESRDALSLTEAAHRVQHNANPNHYAAYEDDARDLVAAILTASSTHATPGQNTNPPNPQQAPGPTAAASDPCAPGSLPSPAEAGQSSVHLSCPAGTTDLGVFDGGYQGARVPIRLCSITGTVCTGSECRAGSLGGVARGEATVNARYAAQFVRWFGAMEQANLTPPVNSAFRTWEGQARLSGGNVADLGYSNHQLGAALDVSGLPGRYNRHNCTGYAPDGACMTSGPLWESMHRIGLQNGLTIHDQEFWHLEGEMSGASRGRVNPFGNE